VNHVLAIGNFAFGFGLADDLGHVVPDRFGEARGVNGDHVGVVDVKHCFNRLQQIGLTAKD